jgi:hypothetical protein
MKYIRQLDGRFIGVDETSELYAKLNSLPAGRRPSFLPASSQQVTAWLGAQKSAVLAFKASKTK